jgi:glyoxylase-like metal-dependent hydrolase (beta-lactamase superfamily II)
MQLEGESKVQSFKLGHVNIYLIATAKGHILVDTGMPGSGKELYSLFARIGLDPQTIQLIVATHGHLDHVGSMAYANRLTGAQVLCHRSFAAGLAAGKAEKAAPQNLRGRFMNLLVGLMGTNIEGTEADILVGDEFDLAEFGIAGRIIATPGHSTSSLSIVLDSGEALIGDLVRGTGPADIGLGMFFEDKEQLLESLERVSAHEPGIIYLSHGTSIDNRTLKKVIKDHRGQVDDQQAD